MQRKFGCALLVWISFSSANSLDCGPGLITFNDTTCLPYVTEYFGECENDVQCEWIGENAYCNFACMCTEGFRWYQGECQKYVGLGENCDDTVTCFDGYNFGSLQCSDGSCKCNEGYFQRGDIDCRKIATKIGDLCALDIDCKFEDAFCKLGKCNTTFPKNIPKAGYFDNEDNLYNLYEYEALEGCKADEGCKSETACETNDECDGESNLQCFLPLKKCVCKRGYFLRDGLCIPEIGLAQCPNNDPNTECPFRPSRCENGMCYCRDYYFVDETNRNCVKTISQNNTNCLSNEWCYALGKHSFCSSNETCQCTKSSQLDENNMLCTPPTEEVTGLCRHDFECRDINGICTDENCGCAANFRLEDERCLPNIGSQCDNTSFLCTIENTYCQAEPQTCACEDKLVANDENLKCFPGKVLGAECEINKQCSFETQYSFCNETICVCDESYANYNNESCLQKKEFGSYCTNEVECTYFMGEDFVCRNSICQCSTGIFYKNGKCSSGVINRVTVFIFAPILAVIWTFYK